MGDCHQAVTSQFFKEQSELDIKPQCSGPRRLVTVTRMRAAVVFWASFMRLLLGFVFGVTVLFSSSAGATSAVLAQGIRLEGVVLDQTHARVAKARVRLSFPSRPVLQTITGADGRFLFESVPAEAGVLIVEARGFAKVERTWKPGEVAANQIEIVLTPAAINEQVTVTASRTETRLDETAASVRVLSASDLSTTAAETIDDALRQVPGFQLFRRSGSRTANPTSQGVSLRGVGASGASRALVLADGVPLNDPFGGWIYWGRVPRSSLNRIEVVRGGASDLYGSGAMGGVIGLITRRVGPPLLELESSYGNQETGDASLFTGGRRGKLGASLAVELFKTDGYVIVPESERGPIDTPANSRHSAVNLRLEYDKKENLQFFVTASYFGESRANGTPVQTNQTHIRQVSTGVDWQSPRVGTLSLRLYSGLQVFDQNFSAVAGDRKTESLTRLQRVPSQVTGLTFQWARALGAKHTLVSGLDAREVRGASDEIVFVQSRASSLVGAGGRERDLGVFLKDIVRLTPRLSVMGGARIDRWRNYDAHADTRALRSGGTSTVEPFPNRVETAFSPQISLLYKPAGSVSLFASANKAFRAPTLNELYRSFRLGNILTLANESLRAERSTGGEAGVGINSFDGRLSLRGSFYWTEITQSIANVTLSSTPDLITRKRQNLGRIRSRGIEVEGKMRFSEYWSADVGYLHAGANVIEFPANRTLEGLRIPQVARDNLTFQLRYANPSRINLGVQGRVVGDQFDDDLNLFRLPGYFTIDALGSRRLNSRLEVFAAAENLFNRRYVTGRTPVTTVGPPLLLRVGFKLHLGS